MLSAYLTDKITLLQDETRDEWGTITAPAKSVPVRGRIKYKTRKVTGIAGEDIVSQGYVILEPKYETDLRAMLNHNQKIEFDDRTWGIVSIEKDKDFMDRLIRVYVV